MDCENSLQEEMDRDLADPKTLRSPGSQAPGMVNCGSRLKRRKGLGKDILAMARSGTLLQTGPRR